MNKEKMHLVNKLFNNEKIRTVWDNEQEYAILTNEIYKECQV